MIGFKVIDTENGREAQGAMYAIQQDGTLLIDLMGFEEVVVPSAKAVPSTTIDEKTTYKSNVRKVIYPDGLSSLIVVTFDDFVGAFAYIDEYNGKKTIISSPNAMSTVLSYVDLGNVYQPEYRHLLPLLEV